MFRKTLPLVALLAVSASASAAVRLDKVISSLLGYSGKSGDSSVPRCESVSGQQRTCNLPAGYRAEYVRQISKTNCILGKNLFIRAGEVIVSEGCRAEFRLIRTGVAGTPGTGGAPNLEGLLAEGLRAKLIKPENEYGSLYEVRILTTKATSPAGSAEQLYTGTANSSWGGRTYPLEYSARVDARSGQLMNLDYRYRNPNATGSTGGTAPWLTGTALDTEARIALGKAIRMEYQKRNSADRVQVVTNTAYKEQSVTRSDFRFSGRYGVSINDGNWQTYRYTARIFLPRNTVSELETNAKTP
ncbi:MAG: DUF3011 domain-containing protein [Pseudomonadota bacterium]|nr:DUF3011 domain-containing protein [Pseudomonadota bacterium]MDQ3159411.1 DUF3011 domain-containing protein [Pseudomonadota bacterium]